VIAAVGIDHEGKKHILGLREGATENATVVTDLLQDIVERGVATGVRRLFVIDGSKALRSAINSVFGKEAAVQRCRYTKCVMLRIIFQGAREDAKNAMKAAFRLGRKQANVNL